MLSITRKILQQNYFLISRAERSPRNAKRQQACLLQLNMEWLLVQNFSHPTSTSFTPKQFCSFNNCPIPVSDSQTLEYRLDDIIHITLAENRKHSANKPSMMILQGPKYLQLQNLRSINNCLTFASSEQATHYYVTLATLKSKLVIQQLKTN